MVPEECGRRMAAARLERGALPGAVGLKCQSMHQHSPQATVTACAPRLVQAVLVPSVLLQLALLASFPLMVRCWAAGAGRSLGGRLCKALCASVWASTVFCPRYAYARVSSR